MVFQETEKTELKRILNDSFVRYSNLFNFSCNNV